MANTTAFEPGRSVEPELDAGKVAVKYAWTLEVVRFIYDHPDADLKDVAKSFNRSKQWLTDMRKSELWERAWYQVGREKLSPAVPKAIREILSALDRGDPTATNLAVKILENTRMLNPEEEAGMGGGSGFPGVVEVQMLDTPEEPRDPALDAFNAIGLDSTEKGISEPE